MRVVWVTNYQAPYREPLWAGLAARCDLEVLFMFGREAKRHWKYDANRPYRSRLLPSAKQGSSSNSARPDSRAWLTWRSIRTILRGADVVVLGGWDQPAYVQLAAVAALTRRPTLAFYESTQSSHRFVRGPVAWLRRNFFRSVNCTLAAGVSSVRALKEMGISDNSIAPSVNAVDVDFFASAASLRLSRSLGPHEYLYVGQLICRKNVDGLLIAFAALPFAARLTIVGDGEDEARLRGLAGSLGIIERVLFVGHLGGMRLLGQYAVAQTLVLPTHEDVWGMVVNEALAAGLQIVVTSRAGVASAVCDLPGVWITSPEPPALAVAMTESRNAWCEYLDPPESLAVTRVVSDAWNAILDVSMSQRGGSRLMALLFGRA